MTPYVGATAADRRSQVGASATSARVTGLTNGTRLHVPGRARRTPRGPGRTRRASARSRRGPRSSTSPRPAIVDARRHGLGRARREVHAPTWPGSITGMRFYKAAANTGTHVGALWTQRRHAARPGDVHQRDRLGLADRHVRHARSRHRRHDLRRGLPRAQRPLLGHRRGVRLGGDRQRAAARARQRRQPATASTPTAATPAFPEQQLQRDQLLGRRPVRPGGLSRCAIRTASAPRAARRCRSWLGACGGSSQLRAGRPRRTGGQAAENPSSGTARRTRPRRGSEPRRAGDAERPGYQKLLEQPDGASRAALHAVQPRHARRRRRDPRRRRAGSRSRRRRVRPASTARRRRPAS